MSLSLTESHAARRYVYAPYRSLVRLNRARAAEDYRAERAQEQADRPKKRQVRR